MKNLAALLLLMFIFIFSNSCSKDDTSPNALGGDTNIALTVPASKTNIYGEYGSTFISGATMTVKSRDNGVVTYEAQVDLDQFSDSLKIKTLTTLTQLASYYKFDTTYTLTPDNVLKFEFKLKVTSEGYADYFTEGKEWVIGKYNDGVGTKYTVQNEKGETLTREVTEKTGLDDWPFGFFYIKTSKIEHVTLADNPTISKVIYRINHKFGLVYVEYQLKDGTTLKLDVWALFI